MDRNDRCKTANPFAILNFQNLKILTFNLNSVSAPFNIGNGVRQGEVLSPTLFCRYINDLLLEMASTNAGCYIGNLCYNVLSYADDLVLCAPSWVALQSLIDVLFKNVTVIDMICNVQKQFLCLIVIKLY